MKLPYSYESHRENQKYRDYIQPLNQNVYEILAVRAASLGVDLSQSSILDYGCNQGHLLTTARGRILPTNYFGVDINPRALELAKAKHPEANWLHYDCFNNTFNPGGVQDLPIPLERQFDVVVAHGVFTHYFMEDIVREIEILKSFAREGGLVLFSIWEDVDFYGYLGFLDRELGMNLGLGKPTKYENGLILVNRQEVLIDVEKMPGRVFDWVEAFYRQDYILRKIPGSVRTQGPAAKHPVYGIRL